MNLQSKTLSSCSFIVPAKVASCGTARYKVHTYADVNLVTAFVPSAQACHNHQLLPGKFMVGLEVFQRQSTCNVPDTACLASSPGSINRTAWHNHAISPLHMLLPVGLCQLAGNAAGCLPAV